MMIITEASVIAIWKFLNDNSRDYDRCYDKYHHNSHDDDDTNQVMIMRNISHADRSNNDAKSNDNDDNDSEDNDHKSNDNNDDSSDGINESSIYL